MATTPVEIFNAALDHLGVEPIVSFSEESKAARIGNRRYAPIRDKLLESHYWNFAEKREELAVVSSSPPVFGFDFKYQLPTDYIKAKHLNVKDSRFKVEQKRFLHTNLSGALLLYTAKITDVSAFSPMFTELLSLDMGLKAHVDLAGVSVSEDLDSLVFDADAGGQAVLQRASLTSVALLSQIGLGGAQPFLRASEISDAGIGDKIQAMVIYLLP